MRDSLSWPSLGYDELYARSELHAAGFIASSANPSRFSIWSDGGRPGRCGGLASASAPWA